MDRTTLAHYVERAGHGSRLVKEISELEDSIKAVEINRSIYLRDDNGGSLVWAGVQRRARLNKSIREAISIAIKEEIALLESELAAL